MRTLHSHWCVEGKYFYFFENVHIKILYNTLYCLFGDIRKYIDPLLDDFDAIGAYGHMSLYKNCDKINTCFKKDGAVFSYKEVFSSRPIITYFIKSVQTYFKIKKFLKIVF